MGDEAKRERERCKVKRRRENSMRREEIKKRCKEKAESLFTASGSKVLQGDEGKRREKTGQRRVSNRIERTPDVSPKKSQRGERRETHVQEPNEPKRRVPTSVDRTLKSERVGRVDLRSNGLVSEEKSREVGPGGDVSDGVEGRVVA